MSSLVIFGVLITLNLLNPVNASVQLDIPTEEEYVSGTITNLFSNMSYVWIHTNETSLLSLMMYNEIYNVAPFYPFFGQSFNVANESFFVGTVITGFELYQDSNYNNILDSKEELRYYIALNGSTGFLLPHVERSVTRTERTYKWKVGYSNVDGFLFPDLDLTRNKKTIIANVNLSYSFKINSNYSELKLAIEMGAWDVYEYTFNSQPPPEELRLQDIDLTNYSLSILFGTTVSSENPISITLTNETTGFSDATIMVNDIPIFQSLFKDTYDLGLVISTHSAIAIPATPETLYDEQVLSWRTPQELYTWWGSFFSSMSDLTIIPALGIEEVSFLYRICYPIWNGEPFSHDPRYRALFNGVISPRPTQTDQPTSEPESSSELSGESSTFSSTPMIQSTPSFLISSVLVMVILVPCLRKKSKL